MPAPSTHYNLMTVSMGCVSKRHPNTGQNDDEVRQASQSRRVEKKDVNGILRGEEQVYEGDRTEKDAGRPHACSRHGRTLFISRPHIKTMAMSPARHSISERRFIMLALACKSIQFSCRERRLIKFSELK